MYSSQNALLSSFLKYYPRSLIKFINECTVFEVKDEKYLVGKCKNLLSELKTHLSTKKLSRRLLITSKELLKIITHDNNVNEYNVGLTNFLQQFGVIYKSLNLYEKEYNSELKNKKVITTLSRYFNVDKEDIISKMLRIIKKNPRDYEEDNYLNDYSKRGNLSEHNNNIINNNIKSRDILNNNYME